MQLSTQIISAAIRQEALNLGFSAVGFSRAEELSEDASKLNEWLQNGFQADMAYMNNHFEKRINPSHLVEGAKTVISLLHNYNPEKPLTNDGLKIARYAYGLDYHDVLKDKLNRLFNYIKENHYPQLEGRVFTDSAPVLERALAVRSGLGWIGKNSNLINPKIGSYTFIAELIVNLDLPCDNEPINNLCGGCTKCVDACPTKAIIKPGVVDSNKCISYLTIENKSYIPQQFEGMMEQRIFGCDICQEVCPWNRKAPSHNEPLFFPKVELQNMNDDDWHNLTEDSFKTLFKGTPIKRAKYSGLMRNIAFITKNKLKNIE